MSKDKNRGQRMVSDASIKKRQARLLKQADMQSSIESQAQVGWDVIAYFFTISGAMLGK